MKASSLGREYAEAWHPGSALSGLMVINDSDLDEVEQKTGASRSDLESLVNLEADMTDELAATLGDIFGQNEAYWRNLQITYDREMGRELRRESAADEVDLLNRFKAKEAVALGWIPWSRDKRERVLAVREYLGLESLKDFELRRDGKFRVTGRRSSVSPGALAMWLRQGEIEAGKRRVGTFDKDAFKQALVAIRAFTRRSTFAFLPAMTELCAGAGVIFLIIENIPNAGAKGVTRWRDDGTPWIQMNFKGNWLDSFWFTFYHEAAHVLQGEREFTVHLDGDSPPEAVSEDELLDETAANELAADILIPPANWHAIRTPNPAPTVEGVRNHAAKLGIHPGIIVGRLQQERIVSWSDARMNRLKSRVTSTERAELSSLNIRHEPPDAAYLAAA